MSETTSARALLALVLVTLLGVALRAPAIGRLLPQFPEPDAFHVVHMQAMRADPAARLHMEFAERYPTLLPRVLAPWPHGPSRAPLASDADLDAHLAAAAQPYVQMRALVMWLALLAVPSTWFIARRFLSSAGATSASYFVATSLLSISFSTQARPHAAAAGLTFAALALALHALDRPSAARIALAGIAALLSAASFQTGVFALPPLAVALYFAPGSRARRWTTAVLVPATAAAIAFAFYPFQPRIDASGIHLAGKAGHEITVGDLNGGGFARIFHYFREYDPALLALSLAGACVAIAWLARVVRERRARAATATSAVAASNSRAAVLTVLAHAVPYAIVLGVNGELYERFVIPLVPHAALLAGATVDAAFERWRTRGAWRFAIAALVAAFSAFPLYVAVKFVRVARAPDTLQQAAQWLRASADPRTARILVSPGLALPLFHSGPALEHDAADSSGQANVWIRYEAALAARAESPPGFDMRLFPALLARRTSPGFDADVERALAEAAPDFVVFECTPKLLMLPAVAHLHDVVSARGQLVFTSRGESTADGAEPFKYQGAERVLVPLLESEACGPRVQIYDMRPGARAR